MSLEAQEIRALDATYRRAQAWQGIADMAREAEFEDIAEEAELKADRELERARAMTRRLQRIHRNTKKETTEK